MKIGTFCSGIGSPEQALKNLGIDHSIEFACEIDKYARETYKANFNPKNFYTDLTKLDYSELPDVDLFVAGFPCQTFSIAGKREGFACETKGTIFFNIYEYLKEKQPEMFILENVKGLLSHDQGNTFRTIIDLLACSVNGQGLLFPHQDSLNYHINYRILNAKDFGIPQNRERIFIIGFKKWQTFNFPKKQTLFLRLADLLEDEVAEKYYLSEKLIDTLLNRKKAHKEKGNGFGCNILDRNSKTSFCLSSRYYKDGSESLINESIIQLNNPTHSNDRIYDSAGETPALNTMQGGRRQPFVTVDTRQTVSLSRLNGIEKEINLAHSINSSDYRGLNRNQSQNAVIEPKALTERRTPEAKKMRAKSLRQGRDYSPRREKQLEVRNDNLSNCITSNQSKEHLRLNAQRIRRLTPLECFRLMGFPDDFKKVGSDTQLYKQAGNSIAVPVMEAIFKKLFN